MLAALACLAGALACEDGSRGRPGTPGAPAPALPTPTTVAPRDDAPALQVEILGLSGASGPGGAFRTGDRVRVRFRMEQRDGTPWLLSEMTSGMALVSGPTFSYQRVIPARTDLLERAVRLADGTFSYTFPPLPDVYAAPYNDTPAFGPGEGELTGQALLGGTYTAAVSVAWDYTVEGEPFQRVGEASRDFRLTVATDGGEPAALEPREVTARANCNRCHVQLQAHGGRHRELALCLACHTRGAEDGNDPLVAGGTPGVSIDSRVLFHRIHNAKHLPSVNGVGSLPDGSRDYVATPAKLLYQAAGGNLRDLSTVGFPVFPERLLPMPRDFGHSALPAPAQAQEDVIRTGVTSCYACHGDPDGAGPLPAPAQGDLIEAQPSRSACGACHDDVDFTVGYKANQQVMPPQPDDSMCFQCHEPSGGPLAIRDAHRHPLRNPTFNAGLNLAILDLAEAPGGNGDGAIDPGEGLRLTLTLRDDAGGDVSAAGLDAVRAVVSGPTFNANLVASLDVPRALLAGPQPFVLDLPERHLLEFTGDSTGALGDVFTTAAAPHFDVVGARTAVAVRTALGPPAFLSAASAPFAAFVDLDDASGFARDDVVVIDDGVPGAEEYLRVQLVDGDRLWFSGPGDAVYAAGPRAAHALGAAVRRATLAPKTAGVDYALDAAAGRITELVEFGAGNAVLVDSSSPFAMPAAYPAPLNASPDLDETDGAWTNKPLVGGTYAVSLSASFPKNLGLAGQTNTYRIASPPARREFQSGAGSPAAPYGAIASASACQACHQDLMFHGGRDRGFDTCLGCHGTAGAEDRPPYVAAGAPPTAGATVSFRTMVHKIHMGSALAGAADYALVGSGGAAWPDNYSVRVFGSIEFPAQPGAARQCEKCHGQGNQAWRAPPDRDHPTAQGRPVLAWTATCGACHDGSAATAHIEANVAPSGVESCAVCHGPGETADVQVAHKAR